MQHPGRAGMRPVASDAGRLCDEAGVILDGRDAATVGHVQQHEELVRDVQLAAGLAEAARHGEDKSFVPVGQLERGVEASRQHATATAVAQGGGAGFGDRLLDQDRAAGELLVSNLHCATPRHPGAAIGTAGSDMMIRRAR